MLFLRALAAFVSLPGLFAGLVPALLATAEVRRGSGSTFGLPLIVLGSILLLWCVRDFFVSGKGTLAPWDPPKRMVVAGLYCFVRNPMYLAVLMVVAGWGVTAGSRYVGWYAAVLATAFHLRVVFHEEPWLRRRFPAEWEKYSAAVPRWLPRMRPWRMEEEI